MDRDKKTLSELQEAKRLFEEMGLQSEAEEGTAGYGIVVPAGPGQGQHHEASTQDEPHGDAFRDRLDRPPIANEGRIA